MTEQALPRPLNGIPAEAAAATLWPPVLLRALAALVFGIVTVFWTSPSPEELCLLVALYFVATAGAQLWLARRLDIGRTSPAALALALPALHLVIAAVVLLSAGSEAVFGWYGGLALVLLGLGELAAGVLLRGTSVLSRDWVISAVLVLGTGLLVPFFIPQGAHALLGVSGGGAVLTGVLWVLSALTLRHDSRMGAKAVN